MKKVTKAQFLSSSVWKLVETFATKGVSLLLSLILARLLLPSDYGIIALTVVFLSLSDLFIQGGFNTALIQKEKVDEADYSTVLVLALAIATVIYVLIFVLSPLVANFFGTELLSSVLRVLGLVVFLQAFASIRTAIVTRNMQFRVLFWCNFIGSILSGVVGIVMALLAFGVWALVAQQFLQQLFALLLLFYKIKWKPVFRFEPKRIKKLFSFSSGVLTSSLLSYVGDSVYSVFFGKAYSVRDLGYLDKGAQLPRQLSLYTFGSLTSVLLPTFSSRQSDPDSLKRLMRKITAFTAYIIFPLMAFLCVSADQIIILLLTEKWLPSVPFLRWSCLYYAATPIMLINVQVFFALGRSYLRVKLETIRFGFLLLLLWLMGFVFRLDMILLVAGQAGIAVLMAALSFIEAQRLVSYNFYEIIEDIFPCALVSIAMLFLGWTVSLLNVHPFWLLLLQAVTCGLFYLFCSRALRLKGFQDVVSIMKTIRLKSGSLI